MATHAIGKHEQSRLPRVAIAHAVFVLETSAFAADLENGKFHTAPLFVMMTFGASFLSGVRMLSNCSLTFSLTVSLV